MRPPIDTHKRGARGVPACSSGVGHYSDFVAGAGLTGNPPSVESCQGKGSGSTSNPEELSVRLEACDGGLGRLYMVHFLGAITQWIEEQRAKTEERDSDTYAA